MMTMMPTVVGLLGRAGSGKTTVAMHLARHYGSIDYGFAEPLKHLAVELFDLAPVQVWGTQAEKEAIDPRYGVSGRTLMQRLGQSARRVIGEDVWVNACLHRMDMTKLATISDVRHVNEAREVCSLRRRHDVEGVVIKLVCLDPPPCGDSGHPSEAEVDMVPAGWPCATITWRREPRTTFLTDEADRIVQSFGWVKVEG